jgi:small subunit ribosomal protein S16
MLTIRLSRIGKKKQPAYRLVISEKARDTYGRALEILGSYDPFTKELAVKKDRIEYWLSQGSGMSPTVNNLLVEKGIIKGEKVKASRMRKKKKGGDEEKATAPEAAKTEGGAPKTEEKPETGQEKPEEKAEKPAEEVKPDPEKKEEKKGEKSEDEAKG